MVTSPELPARNSPPAMCLPQRRILILGASNAARGIASILQASQSLWEEPLDLLAAIGHGRSFGRPSRVLMRGLPSILQCELWNELAARPRVPTSGLITDIGNDILFGESAETIGNWVETALRRLASTCEQIVITELPLSRVERLGPRQYLIARRLLFPKSRVEYSAALGIARSVNQHLLKLAPQFGARVVRPQSEWYAWDPIHIQRRHWPAAWNNILRPWLEVDSFDAKIAKAKDNFPAHSWPLWFRLFFARPHERRMFGYTQHQSQPACILADGSRISLY